MIIWSSLPQNSLAKHLAGFPRTCTVLQHAVVEESTSVHRCLQECCLQPDKKIERWRHSVFFLPHSAGAARRDPEPVCACLNAHRWELRDCRYQCGYPHTVVWPAHLQQEGFENGGNSSQERDCNYHVLGEIVCTQPGELGGVTICAGV